MPDRVENDVFLLLGRLDGRLAHSPARVIWAVRMRLRAIAHASVAAGVPVEFEDVERWIATGGDMPRRREGLNDPLRLSTVAHFTLATQEAARDDLTRSASQFCKPLFDHRAIALDTAADEIVAFTPFWRACMEMASQGGAANLGEITRLLCALTESVDTGNGRSLTVSDLFGRAFHFARSQPTIWLAAICVPLVLQCFGVTSMLLPNLVPPPRVLRDCRKGTGAFDRFLVREARVGIGELDRLERCFATPGPLGKTVRSRTDRAAAYRLAFPPITGSRLAAALGTTPQGGGYLLRQLAAV
jgi:hypothetical protein